MSSNKVSVPEELVIVNKLLKKDLELSPEPTTWEELNRELQNYINHLLNKDFERLLHGLYRIDVDEEKVKEILNVESPEKLSSRLTALILERQRQKAITRMRYR